MLRALAESSTFILTRPLVVGPWHSRATLNGKKAAGQILPTCRFTGWLRHAVNLALDWHKTIWVILKMFTQHTVRSYLHRSISLAKRLESILALKANQKKSILVGFGFLVRNRRLAQAVSQLSNQYAYEKRILIRSMVEIHITYAWIRLKNIEIRANRFIKFAPLEKLKILKDLEPSGLMTQDEYRLKLREYINRRAKVRHLFRNRIKQGKNKGKLRWDRNWASGASLESMLEEVLKSETGKYDSFLYALYRWFSSTVHGGPTSFKDVLEPDRRLRAKQHPESNPTSHLVGAFVVLLATIEALAKSSNTIEDLEPEMSNLQSALNRLKN
jgi:hypothetical protein